MNKSLNFKIGRFLYLLLLNGICFVSSSPQTIESNKDKADTYTFLYVGDKRIKTSLIQSGTDKFILFRVSRGVKQPLSFLTKTVKFEKNNGVEVVVVEQRYDAASGVNTDISLLHRQTLNPLSYASKLADQTESFEFTPTEVKGTIKGKDNNIRQISVPLKDPVFNAVVQDELIQSLPLGENRKFSFRVYNPGKQFFEMTAHVVGSEMLETVGGHLATWVISLEGAAVPTRIWVAKKTQQVILKKSELPNGDEFWSVRLYL